MAKPKVGVWSFTGCEGCQVEMLNCPEIMDLLDKVKVMRFPILEERDEKGKYDICFVEGAITTKEEEEKLKDVRKRTNFLVALGTCATYGGIPSIKNFLDEKKVEKTVYRNTSYLHSEKAEPLEKFIKVDYNMRGCPPDKDEFVRVFKDLLLEKKPKEPDFPVCVECRKKENPCLLEQGHFCLGPVTHGGCDAVCPSNEVMCHGCRGPLKDANIKREIEIFEKKGATSEDLKRILIKFAGEKFRTCDL
ncbi:NADH:ubiquinone oxidoreductase [Candidatus Woesearchaeota archaeon]|nr:NADH:ubiquinone oxidoreductase [Candidatus Woesearchaeota archaeon]